MFYGSGGTEYSWNDIIQLIFPLFIEYILPLLIFIMLCLINKKLKIIINNTKKD